MRKVDITLAELVIEEATNLKKVANQSEIDRLSPALDDLDADLANRCIYGQMTGNCFNDRASLLIRECATQVYNVVNEDSPVSASVLNGKPKAVSGIDRKYAYFSPIEKYIVISKKKTGIKALLEYIKGIRPTIEVKDLYTGK
jgi:hypothetical protein